MLTCPACGNAQTVAQRYCGHCGASLQLSAAATSPPPDADLARPVDPPHIASDRGRYLPGVIFASRYRIVALLGRGGMGEVYRADDLKLGQPVALKFLPRDSRGDPERLERFHNEVRLARQIAHPNVCRVYDIGEAEGRHSCRWSTSTAKISRRCCGASAGCRDKAVEIARQLCAGLRPRTRKACSIAI